MEPAKPQLLVLDKSQLDSVVKALSQSGFEIENQPLGINKNLAQDEPSVSEEKDDDSPVHQLKIVNTYNNEKSKNKLHPSPIASLSELGKKLSNAARIGDSDTVKGLIGIGAPFTDEGQIGNNPLHFAASCGHLETCEILIEARINRNATNKVKKTALHMAAMEGHIDVVNLLLKHEADIDARDMLNMTPLHWACDRGHKNIAKCLLKLKADTSISNKFNLTPIQLAVNNRHYEIAKMIRDGVDEDREFENYFHHMPENLDNSDIPHVSKTEEVCTEECIDEHIEGIDGTISQDEDPSHAMLDTLVELTKATSDNQEPTFEMTSSAALELLKAEAASLPTDDTSALITNAVAHGLTIHLTEAGKQALKLIKPDPLLITKQTLMDDTSDTDDEKFDKKRKFEETGIMTPTSIKISKGKHLEDTNNYTILTEDETGDIILQVVGEQQEIMYTTVADTPVVTTIDQT